MAAVAMMIVRTDFNDDEAPSVDFTAIVLVYAWWMAGTVIGAATPDTQFELDEIPSWSVVQDWVLEGPRPEGINAWLAHDVG